MLLGRLTALDVFVMRGMPRDDWQKSFTADVGALDPDEWRAMVTHMPRNQAAEIWYELKSVAYS